uniref:Uncharacterized protein n=1 Tax=viral metagenome TaxID=1070528 RepID=A0A6H1ZRI6_9ZZZZ
MKPVKSQINFKVKDSVMSIFSHDEIDIIEAFNIVKKYCFYSDITGYNDISIIPVDRNRELYDIVCDKNGRYITIPDSILSNLVEKERKNVSKYYR